MDLAKSLSKECYCVWYVYLSSVELEDIHMEIFDVAKVGWRFDGFRFLEIEERSCGAPEGPQDEEYESMTKLRTLTT